MTTQATTTTKMTAVTAPTGTLSQQKIDYERIPLFASETLKIILGFTSELKLYVTRMNPHVQRLAKLFNQDTGFILNRHKKNPSLDGEEIWQKHGHSFPIPVEALFKFQTQAFWDTFYGGMTDVLDSIRECGGRHLIEFTIPLLEVDKTFGRRRTGADKFTVRISNFGSDNLIKFDDEDENQDGPTKASTEPKAMSALEVEEASSKLLVTLSYSSKRLGDSDFKYLTMGSFGLKKDLFIDIFSSKQCRDFVKTHSPIPIPESVDF